MHERREIIPKAPKDIFYNMIQDYADKGIYESEEYKEAEKEFDVDNRITIPYYFRKGIANVISRIQLIRQLENDDQKMKLFKQRENGGIPAEWFETMLNWDPKEDKYGVEKLRECREMDYRSIIKEINVGVDFIQASELEFHAEAMKRAEDILIDSYHVKRLMANF